MNKSENTLPLYQRLWIYQKERFPLVQHVPLIAAFTFSAASYSMLCRGEISFIDLSTLCVGIFTTLCFFLLLRLFDEFKDFEDDCQFRPYRPIPRGLVSLTTLRWMIVVIISLVLVINLLVTPKLLIPIVIILLYMSLMTKEFFVSNWLKKNPMFYMSSHMIIMPLIDLYATGLDWLVQGTTPSTGVGIFLLVSFFNGMVIEIGRKIRVSEKEEIGVETYSALYGSKLATQIWISVVLITFIFAVWAAFQIPHSLLSIILLVCVFCFCLIPARKFIVNQTVKGGKNIETAAGLWTLGMYLILGATPMVVQSLQ